MYKAPVEEIAFTLKHVAGMAEALAAGTFGEQPANTPNPLATPLEAAEFKRLSAADEVAVYLARLDREFDEARVETIGTSVEGRPILALVLSQHAEAGLLPWCPLCLVGSKLSSRSVSSVSPR